MIFPVFFSIFHFTTCKSPSGSVNHNDLLDQMFSALSRDFGKTGTPFSDTHLPSMQNMLN